VIRTFGDVTIHRGAASLGSTIDCHNLFVHGELSSRVRATGTVTFWSSGVVLGQIDCERLVIDRQSSLRFVQRVTARTIEIHGSVVGEFVSDGDVLLSRRASLSGVVLGKTFEMNLAAELLARMEFHP
jgi:cytoskeletal protein CcmA (bactofilin family)